MPADTPQQAAARRQLRARGEQLAPRITPGSTSRAGRPAPQPATLDGGGPGGGQLDGNGPGEYEGPAGGGSEAERRRQERQARQDRQRVYAQARKPFRSTSRVLVAEFILCLALVALKPSEPAGEGQASESTVPQLASVMVVFLLLAALASAGPRAQRVANLAGGLVTLVLLFKNHGYVTMAVTGVTTYQTPGTPAGAASATSSTPGSSASSGGIEPTPTGQPSEAEQAVTGWRGASVVVPTPSGQPSEAQQYLGG